MKKYLGIICLLFSGIIIYVWSFDLLKYFLAPQMQLYLKIALFPLIIMGLIILFNNKFDYKFKISDLILLLPLIIIILSGDGKLSMNYAVNKLNTNKEQKINEVVENEGKQEENKEETPSTDITYDFSTVDVDVVDSSYNELANYITFENKASRFVGQKIRFRGYTIANASYLPSGSYGIGKYTITCCAADAEFAGFVVKTSDELKENTWYEIEGVIESYNKDGIVNTIKAINIKEIDGNKEERYVYACYAYDNGSCKEISKYNLEY